MLVKYFLPPDIIIMAPKRATSKDTIESSTMEAVEQTPVDFPVYAET